MTSLKGWTGTTKRTTPLAQVTSDIVIDFFPPFFFSWLRPTVHRGNPRCLRQSALAPPTLSCISLIVQGKWKRLKIVMNIKLRITGKKKKKVCPFLSCILTCVAPTLYTLWCNHLQYHNYCTHLLSASSWFLILDFDPSSLLQNPDPKVLWWFPVMEESWMTLFICSQALNHLSVSPSVSISKENMLFWLLPHLQWESSVTLLDTSMHSTGISQLSSNQPVVFVAVIIWLCVFSRWYWLNLINEWVKKKNQEHLFFSFIDSGRCFIQWGHFYHTSDLDFSMFCFLRS